MGKLSLSKMACFVFVFCAMTGISSSAQTFTTLFSFNGTNGGNPRAGLVQGTDGNLYGTTTAGGASTNCGTGGCGTVFRISSAGALTMLHGFSGSPTDGSDPSGLVQASDGNFYGTTLRGGTNNQGTVFRITGAGTLTTLYSFCARSSCADGAVPSGVLVQATDGNFYGTTSAGGTNSVGTMFKITPGGGLTTLHIFSYTDGMSPIGGLVQATDGNFYGTALEGGASPGYGTVFKITPGGTLTTLHDFNDADGFEPSGGLVQATDGNFYGTTTFGGSSNSCSSGCGTVFEITPGGTLTTLHSFDITDGALPAAGLIQATDGNFYGTTQGGGSQTCSSSYGCGTVFKISPGGALTTLHSFDGTDGYLSQAGLVQATDGNFYGTTYGGGTNGLGTVFRVGVGLGPFVETIPTSGAVGAAIIILGNNLTGATGVKFNGTAATFTVVSSSEIQTTVPAGATTGIVQVTTPSGTLNSNLPFQVTKTRKRLVQVTSE